MPDQTTIEIDERWLADWVEHGMRDLEHYLLCQANFERWLAQHREA